jgi:hypothetical protein
MTHDIAFQAVETPPAGATAPARWTPPAFEILSLDCEITAYAPDGDAPLF